MTEKRELTCIGCPLGCLVSVELTDGGITRVSGNTCQRGDVYARKEVTHPTRIVTSTVGVTKGAAVRVSVKTQTDIPKDRIFACIEALRGINVQAPVHIGDVIVADVAGTGVNVVATKEVEAAPAVTCI